MSDDDHGELAPVEVRSYFVRNRNFMLARGKFDGMYMDYYLHLMQHGLKPPETLDLPLKEALAALTLHLASLPRGEASAWTWHKEHPLANLFVAGDNNRMAVTGRYFDKEIRETGRDLLIVQRVRSGQPTTTSTVDVTGQEIFRGLETFYEQSEQRRARMFTWGDEEFVLLTAQPQADEEWLDTLDDEAIRTLDQREELSLLEERIYRFDCGCRRENMIDVLMRLPSSEREHIFEDQAVIRMQCPRCGAWYELSKEEAGI